MKISKSDLKGDLRGLSLDIVARMLECQVQQGNRANIDVFQGNRGADRKIGGFSWPDTVESFEFWAKILSFVCPDPSEFYSRYPKGSIYSFQKYIDYTASPITKSCENTIKNNNSKDMDQKIKFVYKTHNVVINGLKRKITFSACFINDTPRVGYSVVHPSDEIKSLEPSQIKLGETIARNRALDNRTNLLPHGTMSKIFHTRQLLRHLIEEVKWQLENGVLSIKGIR